jgi:hypothetical protein
LLTSRSKIKKKKSKFASKFYNLFIADHIFEAYAREETIVAFFCSLLHRCQEALSSHTSEEHIIPHDAQHIISMNAGGAVLLQRGDEVTSGAFSDEESVTCGGVSLRRVKFCLVGVNKSMWTQEKTKRHWSCSVLACMSRTVMRLWFHLIMNRGCGF